MFEVIIPKERKEIRPQEVCPEERSSNARFYRVTEVVPDDPRCSVNSDPAQR